MPTPFFLHTGWYASPMQESSYAYSGTFPLLRSVPMPTR